MGLLIKILPVLILLITIFYVSPSEAYYYWFSPTGSETVYTSCQTATDTPPSGSTTGPSGFTTGYCAPTASRSVNYNVDAGDTVYYRAGTYNVTSDQFAYIQPEMHSGTAENKIVYSPYNGEEVIINGDNASSTGIRLTNAGKTEGRDYIKITGFIFQNLSVNATLWHGADYNEISYCTFKTSRDTFNDIVGSGTVTTTTEDGKTLIHADTDTGANLKYSTIAFHNTTDRSMCQSGNSYCYKGEWSDATTYHVYDLVDYSGSHYRMTNLAAAGTLPTNTSYWETYSASAVASGYCVRECSGGYTESVLAYGTDNMWQSGDSYKLTPQIYSSGIEITYASVHNWIHHNIIYGYGQYGLVDGGRPLEVGGIGPGTDGSNNNTIEYNHIYWGGHHVIGVNASRYNVVRHNYIHNEAWYDDSAHLENGCGTNKCGYRVASMTSDDAYGGYSLYEDNTWSFGDAYGGVHLGTGSSGSGMKLALIQNIYRYNDHVGNATAGLYFGASTTNSSDDNRVYNNTFYHNGYREGADAETEDEYRCGLFFYASGYSGNVVKNNLFYDHWSQDTYDTNTSYWPAITAGNDDAKYATNMANNTITNNYLTVTETNPYFRSSTVIAEKDNPFANAVLPANSAEIVAAWNTTTYSVTSPNLSLSPLSTAVNAGTYLTQTNGSGSNSTTLIVDDSTYFQDGTLGSALSIAYNGTGSYIYEADWICISSSATNAGSNCVQIESIDSSTQITLSTATTWSGDDYVWLYKKSDGAQVLYGSAPDYGAHEYTGTTLYRRVSGGSCIGCSLR